MSEKISLDSSVIYSNFYKCTGTIVREIQGSCLKKVLLKSGLYYSFDFILSFF